MALEIFSDLSERLNYNFPGFPLYVRKGELCQFERYTVACHWHPDLEFIFVLDGSMEYFVNGKTVHMEKGEGIFVNSKRLHYNYSKDATNCVFYVIVVHPSLLGGETHAGNEYLESRFSSENEDCMLLTGNVAWQREALASMAKIYEETQSETCNLLRLLSQSVSLCASVIENIQKDMPRHADERSWLTVWRMTGFIQKGYADKVTLDDIAAAGSVCRSRCCKLFNEYVGQTPNDYLMRYRINKSCEMLRETNMTTTEISMACGFQSPSYYTQVFHKEIGLTPRDYRGQYKSSTHYS